MSKKMESLPRDVRVNRRPPTRAEIDSYIADASSLWRNSRHHLFLALDLEFTRNKFALIQMCFDTGRGAQRRRDVYLSNSTFDGMVDLLTCPYIVKLMHGSESNDVPWLLSQIPSSKQAELFVNFVDTRFISEYLNPDMKAGLYEVLMRYDAVTEEQVKGFAVIEKSLGHIQHVDWNLGRIKDGALEYAIHDVLHLRRVYSEARKMDNTIPQFRNILRICFLQRFLKVLNAEDVDRANNYYVGRTQLTLFDLSTRVIEKLKVRDLDLSRIMRIGWMRPPTQLLLRRIIYGLAVRHTEVMIDKKNKFDHAMEPLPNRHIRWSSLDHLIIELRQATNHILASKGIYDK